jgi:hypothetical protein
MKRSDFLKSLAVIAALPTLLVSTPIGKELPYEIPYPEFSRIIQTDDILSNLIDDIISKTGGKINGHTISRVYFPRFLVQTNEGDVVKSTHSYKTKIHINDEFFVDSGIYGGDVKDDLNKILITHKDAKDLLVDEFIKELKGRVDKPTYLYKLIINKPIINPFTFTSEYSFIMRMA